MNSEEYNPWTVGNIEDFLYFCCPECDLSNESIFQAKDIFIQHVLFHHPKAKEFMSELALKEEPIEEFNNEYDESYAVENNSKYFNYNNYRNKNLITKSRKCGECENCLREDCGECNWCIDKPRFGGPGLKKQACKFKVCINKLNNKKLKTSPSKIVKIVFDDNDIYDSYDHGENDQEILDNDEIYGGANEEEPIMVEPKFEESENFKHEQIEIEQQPNNHVKV